MSLKTFQMRLNYIFFLSIRVDAISRLNYGFVYVIVINLSSEK